MTGRTLRDDDFEIPEVGMDDDDEDFDECGLSNDGRCSMAGSEWCDFECPYRDSEMFAGSTAWRIKHGEKL